MFCGFLITLETCLRVRMSSWDVYPMCLWSHKHRKCFNLTFGEINSSDLLISSTSWSGTETIHDQRTGEFTSVNWAPMTFPCYMYGVTNGTMYRYCFGSPWANKRIDRSLESWFTPECIFFAKIHESAATWDLGMICTHPFLSTKLSTHLCGWNPDGSIYAPETSQTCKNSVFY